MLNAGHLSHILAQRYFGARAHGVRVHQALLGQRSKLRIMASSFTFARITANEANTADVHSSRG